MSQTSLDPMQPVLSGSVDADIPCRKCAYNLRGLQLDGRCPECGTPVGVSVNGELLRYSDPRFVYGLRQGISLILWGILITLIVVGATVALTIARMIPPNSPYLHLIYFITFVPNLMGSWLLTNPDPSGIGEDRYGTSRKIIRLSLAIGILNNVITFVAETNGPMAPSVRIAFQVTEIGMQIVGVIGAFALMAYLKKLALRIPNVGLSRTANSLMWGLGLCFAILLACFLFAYLMATGVISGGGGFGSFLGFAILGVFIVLLIFGILYLLMLFSFGRQFEEQARLAHALWLRAKPSGEPIQT